MKKKIISSIIAIVLAITTIVIPSVVIMASKDEQTTQETTGVSVAAPAAEEITETTTEVTTVIATTEREKTTKETTLASKSTTVVQSSCPVSENTEDSLNTFQGVELQYSAPYNITDNKLTRRGGVAYYNGHKETWYSQKVLPGGGLKIPGRHVADDGTIRDGEGYICVAADPSYYPKGATLMTSLGPAKVYDCGCAYGIIDIYVNW